MMPVGEVEEVVTARKENEEEGGSSSLSSILACDDSIRPIMGSSES